jgi:hypothetical protein
MTTDHAASFADDADPDFREPAGALLSGDTPEWPEPEFELILRTPIERPDGSVVASIMLREPTGAEWEAINEQPLPLRRRYAISRIGGLPMAVTAKMGIGDLVRGEN